LIPEEATMDDLVDVLVVFTALLAILLLLAVVLV